ncbi:MAG TPA: hypothetical protein VI076_16450 [Actinopolymorphaceae bacterium]
MFGRSVGWLSAAFLVTILVTMTGGLTSPAAADKPAPVTVSVLPDRLSVLAAPCGTRWIDLTITNTTSQPRYVDVYITPESPVHTSHDQISTYLPPDRSVEARVQISADTDAPVGTYDVSFRVGPRGPGQATVPVTVTPRPTGPGANLALGGPAEASSTHGNFSACGAFDGNTNHDDWSTATGWNDGTSGVFPDWLAVRFPKPQQVSRVVAHTLDSSRYPAARYGLKDWDVQVLTEGEWQTVAQVRGNTTGVVTSTFEPVTTSAVRISALASNDATYSRLVELEVYAD